MKITAALIDKLLRLHDGETIPASQLRGEWTETLVHDGILISTSHGIRRTLHAPNPEAFLRALSSIDERFSDLKLMRQVLSNEDASRSMQAGGTGNSKLVTVRSCPGFPVNSYEPVSCVLSGRDFVVNPEEGSFLFITDWQSFSIPSDIVVVGIENMENFRMIRRQRKLFENTIGNSRFLFVSRYPQSGSLRSWLQTIPNKYVHFGDFDLAGINIFLTEFHAFLGNRSSFLIPSDVKRRLTMGSFERYNDQYKRFRNISTNIPELQDLIDSINKYHRCYDQEGYIVEQN